jgi:hypothetical protein
VALTSAASSLPTKSHFFRPTASRRSARSGAVVVDGQTAVVEEALERVPLIPRVADRLRGRRLVEGVLDLDIAPRKERVDGRRFPPA